MNRLLIIAACVSCASCAARNYTYYLIEPTVKKNTTLKEDDTLVRPFGYGSTTVMKVRWNDGKVMTEVDVPVDLAAVEARLARNPQYAYALALGQLQPLLHRRVARLYDAATLIGLDALRQVAGGDGLGGAHGIVHRAGHGAGDRPGHQAADGQARQQQDREDRKSVV